MRPFEYLAPTTVGEALGLLSEHAGEAVVLAGGQSLLLDLKSRQRAPARLVSLAGITDLDGVTLDGPVVRIGPTTTYRGLADGDALGFAAAEAPVAGFLSRVAADIADRAVRSMATVGGSACQAEPAFDMPVALSTVGARFQISAAGGTQRTLEAHEFFLGAKRTALTESELLSGILVPNPAGRWIWGYAKQGMRAHDAALASVGVALGLDDAGVVQVCRLVVGGAVNTPQRTEGAENWTINQPAAEIDPHEFGRRAAAEITPEIGGPRFGPEYRHRLIPVLARRALRGALDED